MCGLQLASLKRYRHIFKLGDVPGGTKEDLIPAIQRHFAQQVRFIVIRRDSKPHQHSACRGSTGKLAMGTHAAPLMLFFSGIFGKVHHMRRHNGHDRTWYESAYVRYIAEEALQEKLVWVHSRCIANGRSNSCSGWCDMGRMTWMINALNSWQHR